MYLLGLTERTLTIMDITVYSGYNISHLKGNVNVHYIKKEYLLLGAISIKTPLGLEVISYDIERITCDLISSKNYSLEKEQVYKFIRMVFLNNMIDSIKLIDYSKKLKCEKK